MDKKESDHRLRKVVLTAFVCLLLVIGGASIMAQSGRRIKNPVPTPTATPTPEPTSKPSPKVEIKPDYTVRVINSIPTTIHQGFMSPENMPYWVIERLRSSVLLEVESGGTGTYKNAQEMSKLSDQAYILFVQLDEDPFGGPRGGRSSAESGYVWISFYLFTPQTGKVKHHGRSELKPEILNNRRIWDRNSRCYPANNADYLLWQASYEVAERVMSGLSLPIPAVTCK